jgi:hypothetical protein
MDLATFQWIAGIIVTLIFGLVGWIAKTYKEENKELRIEVEKLRDSTEAKVEKLHVRINDQAREVADLRTTVAGFQAVFITREEHSRCCVLLQQHQSR